jgi:hypothetical protein
MSENKKDIKMKFVKIGILILVGLDIVFACSPVNVKNLTFYKKSVVSDIPFRIDGYYYSKNCYSNNNNSYVYFFYPDGFFLGGYTVYDNSPLTLMDAKLDSSYNIWERDITWVGGKGAFKIVNDSVRIQFFHCLYTCNIVNKQGRIINDSTLLFITKKIDKSEYLYNHDPDYCDTFHFRKLDWKPDSTYQIGFDKELKKRKYKF